MTKKQNDSLWRELKARQESIKPWNEQYYDAFIRSITNGEFEPARRSAKTCRLIPESREHNDSFREFITARGRELFLRFWVRSSRVHFGTRLAVRNGRPRGVMSESVRNGKSLRALANKYPVTLHDLRQARGEEKANFEQAFLLHEPDHAELVQFCFEEFGEELDDADKIVESAVEQFEAARHRILRAARRKAQRMLASDPDHLELVFDENGLVRAVKKARKDGD